MKTIICKKNRIWPFVFFILPILLFPTGSSALVIDFEELSPGPVKDGYQSLHWCNVSVVQSSSGLLDGNVAYGTRMSIYSDSLGYFNLESMELASESTNTIWIEAFAFSDSKFKQEVDLEDLDEVLLDLNLLGITRIDMWSEDNTTFMIDNLKVSWLCGGGECGTVEPSETSSKSFSDTPCNPSFYYHHKCKPPYPYRPPCKPPGSSTPVPEPSTLVLLMTGLATISRLVNRSK